MVTLDPLGATDLDQAFALTTDGPTLLLHYAIADVGWFVRPGGAVDAEAWRRGLTIYLPDHKTPLYPPVLAESAASLLPDGSRPAIVLEVALDGEGTATLRAARRAVIRSRAKLAYETVAEHELPPLLSEFARRAALDEERRGASRVEFPEQEVRADPDREGAFRLELRERSATEDHNAAMSLAANLAVANVLVAARTGLFRTMDDPDEREVEVLRRVAAALGIEWPPRQPLGHLLRTLPHGPRPAAFLLAVRRASGGAGYAPYAEGATPWHAAIAAPYVHATAPLRRLADRYVLEAVIAAAGGKPVPGWVTEAYDRLPAVMASAGAQAAKVERAAVDLTEAVALARGSGSASARP